MSGPEDEPDDTVTLQCRDYRILVTDIERLGNENNQLKYLVAELKEEKEELSIELNRALVIIRRNPC